MNPDWLIFDLDDTLYTPTTGVWDAIGDRINLYIDQKLNLPKENISKLRDDLFHAHGTTLRGLQIEYGVDALDYLAFVHDIPIEDYLTPNDALRVSLNQISIKKCIFTNADRAHAQRVLDTLHLSGCFDLILDVVDVAPFCKPYPQAFTTALEILRVTDPARCAIFEDSTRNILAARQLGLFTIQVGSNGQPPVGHLHIHSINEILGLFSNPTTLNTGDQP